MDSPTLPPLILTLALDEESAEFFNALRRQHFPPERNYLDAHLTLFHHLPGTEQAALTRLLSDYARRLAPLPLEVSGLQFLGQGVAYRVGSAALQELHRELQQAWWPWLTPQDQQKRRPHVTIQNKVRPEVARSLHQQLSSSFQPFSATGIGLQLWIYRNGPWEALQYFPFGA
ncbi:2'-5' RNA ligase family protein [Hymenobacter cellulosilyticus]|uniref:2'-5' RNA ligase family protein n=1 Tax=Hymenobacter cellulosilyticus TaxID=2932248 RepID=A0A8T9PYH8_9BACT|nr:2'-5' RNA ligase family protein [Hymenobacter cellulosilyticus]UOQ70127.1 2'-5' RNA ligase family protein [Hymenobacter cellulosilyticus]